MVTPKVTWNLGFTHNNWALKSGTSFPIVLTFDGRARPGRAAGPTLLPGVARYLGESQAQQGIFAQS